MSIQEYLTYLDDLIDNSNIFNNWGSECINMTDKPRIYGISKKQICQGNLFSQNDFVPCEGYMWLDLKATEKVNLNKLVSQVVFKIKVELFISNKSDLNIKTKFMELVRLFKDKKVVSSFAINEKDHVTFTIEHKVFAGCDDLVIVDGQIVC
jgi:hypothetical protein